MRRKYNFIISAALILILGIGAQVLAQAPNTFMYQGRLTNAAGAPITTATSVVFAVYAASSGGTALWTETRSITPDAQGVFTVELGTSTALPATLFDGTKRYLGIRAGADTEMTPRQVITSGPYSLSVADVPGIASAFRYANTALTGTAAKVDSVTISCPSAGYVVVQAVGYFGFTHASGGGARAMRAAISTTGGTIDFNNFSIVEMPSVFPSGFYYTPFSIIFTRTVAAAGNIKFYLNADSYSGTGYQSNGTIDRHHLVATFYPVSYGLVGSTMPPNDGNINPLDGSIR